MNVQAPPSTAPLASGVKLAIMQKRFDGVTRKMANTLLRTARSGVINTARDFSCALVTADCELLTAADSYPIHVIGGADLMARAMLDIHPDLKRGDAFLHNSPYHGNSHAADHTILVPVFDDNDVHRFTVVSKAHQADCGNSLPTTYMGNARDVYEEGALIFPAVKVQSDYVDNRDIINMCMMRIRVPEQWRGDYLAMLGAARIGEREIMRMGRELGWEALSDHATQWFDMTERRMVEIISTIASGSARGTCTHDPLPGTPAGGIPANADVTVDAENGRITVDLTDNIDCLPVGVNLSEACARTAALVGVLNSLPQPVTPNAGSLRRIEVRLRENCCVGIPRHPHSTSVATTNLGDRVSNAVQLAMAAIDPKVGMAEGGAALPPAAGVISGHDPRNGHAFVNEVILAAGGGPGTPVEDGWLSLFCMGNAGMPFYDSVEIDEMLHPMMIETRKILTDSEGAGAHRGAPGIVTVFRPIDCDFELGFCSDGTVNPSLGTQGGGNARPARQYLESDSGEITEMTTSEHVHVRADQRVVSMTNGGGGHGDPAVRDPRRVARDVEEGWVSPERARAVYRVALTPEGAVDEAATAALRVA
ncbi:hydantoinase B/oxoprolinase family protein [Ancylobacter pratisalsi]|uniref:Hydantoinase B/oxoprolinase family protein n=1 Tax=Ancylobacter pratisalsi TaxID=1745854 RepID=A0A6P1YQ36_9HYPH|nr:hydantoinase B/oxoprolinase family protein [Ancylobacter pratisalsi]QIB35577.1 hydantoinase B/oxoprolinase family protein [Ancylobacter pratisalsi]